MGEYSLGLFTGLAGFCLALFLVMDPLATIAIGPVKIYYAAVLAAYVGVLLFVKLRRVYQKRFANDS